MPEICRFYGIIITMFYDDHNPPHFHVMYNEYRAIVSIANGEVSGNIPRRVLNMVYEWLDLHKDELLENWRRMTESKDPEKIAPLD